MFAMIQIFASRTDNSYLLPVIFYLLTSTFLKNQRDSTFLEQFTVSAYY